MKQVDVALPGFERGTVHTFQPALDCGRAPENLLEALRLSAKGHYYIDLQSADGYELPKNFTDDMLAEIGLLYHKTLQEHVSSQLVLPVHVEIQRQTVLPGRRALWDEADNWHCDIVQIPFSHAPVMTIPMGIGTQALVGSIDVVDVFQKLSTRSKRQVLSMFKREERDRADASFHWKRTRPARVATELIKRYAYDHGDDALPEGLSLQHLPSEHVLLIAGMEVGHRSDKNTTSHNITKTHTHIWPTISSRDYFSLLRNGEPKEATAIA